MGHRLPVPEQGDRSCRSSAGLDEDDAARAAFAALDSRNRYAILYQIEDAKRPETRARRIVQYVAMLSEGRKPYA